MNRDMELIKQILKYVECKGPSPREFLFSPDISGYSEEKIAYHIRLCSDVGHVRTNSSGALIELTWSGHEALDCLRRGAAEGQA